MTGFSRLHPAVELSFFVLVLAFAMFLSNPAIQLIGLLCAAMTACLCVGRKRFLRQTALLLPLMLFTAVINPLFSHEGVTVLFYFPSGNACTLESVLYGLSAAIRLATVLLWFVGWNTVITSDKFVFLFGRAIPSLALTISMGLRFIPRLLRRVREVSDAQKCLNPQKSKFRHAGNVISIVITWALENALDTADSMRCRGYGVTKRSAFSLYRFTARDACALSFFLLCGAGVLAAALTGALRWQFFPTLSGVRSIGTALGAVLFALLCVFPAIFEAKEALQWHALKSKI